MLDRHVAQQIHGTNSTKSCQINRSQKKFGALFVGNFSKLGRTRQKQARKRSVGLQNREKPGSDTIMIQGGTLISGSFTFGGWHTMNTGNHKGKMGEDTRGKHSINTKTITQALDSRYKVEIHDPKSTTVIQIAFSRRRS